MSFLSVSLLCQPTVAYYGRKCADGIRGLMLRSMSEQYAPMSCCLNQLFEVTCKPQCLDQKLGIEGRSGVSYFHKGIRDWSDEH